MIFIPLGLFIPIHRMPWMTLFIALLTVVFSLRNFGPFENLEKQSYRSEAQRRVLSSKLKILASICPESGALDADTCRLLKIVSLRPVENLSQPFNEIKHGLLRGPHSNQHLAFISDFVFSPTIPKRFQLMSKGSPDYASWKSAMDQFGDERNQLIRKYGFLSKAHWNFHALLKAQLTHGGYLHLFGNLLFFALVSIFVELRLGSLRSLALYTLAGFGGLSAELWNMESLSTPLIGASANIAGLSGAFAALFWQKRVKVLASFFFVFIRIISIPVYFFFPVLVFGGDLVGALNPMKTGVAYLAHLSGFAIGFGIAILMKKRDGLPPEFLSNEEFESFKKINSLTPAMQIPHYIHLLKMNPENPLIHHEILSKKETSLPWSEMRTQLKNYLEFELPKFLFLEREKPKEFLATLACIPESLPLEKLLGKFSGRDLLRFSGMACLEHRFSEGLRILNYLEGKFPEFKEHHECLKQRQLIRTNQEVGRRAHAKTG